MNNVSSINVQSYQISPMPNEKMLGPQIRSLYKGNDFQNSMLLKGMPGRHLRTS
jgi:hypothetical protein